MSAAAASAAWVVRSAIACASRRASALQTVSGRGFETVRGGSAAETRKSV